MKESIPNAVIEISNFCEHNKLNVQFSRNEPASNCKDASSKRKRHGRVGIPLFDELKSSIEYYYDNNGEKVIIATHYRGNQMMDRALIEKHIEKKIEKTAVQIQRLEKDELLSRFGMQFGTVNPILLEVRSQGKIRQFFDESLFKPGTMMTNAGNHTWAIEFSSDQLAAAIKRKSVLRFAYE